MHPPRHLHQQLLMSLFRNNGVYKNIFLILASLFLFVCVMLFAPTADAANPPNSITYQGKLLENGISVTTTKNMRFVIYDAASGGTVLYTADGTTSTPNSISIPVQSGTFSIDLGGVGTNPLPTSLFNTTNLFLEITIEGTTLSPRKRLTSVPFAINSALLSGNAATSTPQSSRYIPVAQADGSFVFNTTTVAQLFAVGESAFASNVTIGSNTIDTANMLRVHGNTLLSGTTTIGGMFRFGNTIVEMIGPNVRTVLVQAEVGPLSGTYANLIGGGNMTAPGDGSEGWLLGAIYTNNQGVANDRVWMNIGTSNNAQFRRLTYLESDGTLIVPSVSTTILTLGGDTITSWSEIGGDSLFVDGGGFLYPVTTTNALVIGTSSTPPTGTMFVVVGGDALINGLTIGLGGGQQSLNTAVGSLALFSNTDGIANIAVGPTALFSNTSGNFNIGIGWNALRQNTTGGFNVALGHLALVSSTSGGINTAIGSGALSSNTIGGENTVVGAFSAQDNTTGNGNSIFGAGTFRSNTQGSFNTVIGRNSLDDAVSGDYNTVLGYASGDGVIIGSNNTILGSRVSGLPADLSNNIIIADGTGQQRIRVLANGYVGIGTTVPISEFDVVGTTTLRNNLIVGTATTTIMPFHSNFIIDGNDAYFEDMVGINNELFVRNAVTIGTSSMRLSSSFSNNTIRLTRNPLDVVRATPPESGPFDVQRWYTDNTVTTTLHARIDSTGTFFANSVSATAFTLNGDTITEWPAEGENFWTDDGEFLSPVTSSRGIKVGDMTLRSEDESSFLSVLGNRLSINITPTILFPPDPLAVQFPIEDMGMYVGGRLMISNNIRVGAINDQYEDEFIEGLIAPLGYVGFNPVSQFLSYTNIISNAAPTRVTFAVIGDCLGQAIGGSSGGGPPDYSGPCGLPAANARLQSWLAIGYNNISREVAFLDANGRIQTIGGIETAGNLLVGTTSTPDTFFHSSFDMNGDDAYFNDMVGINNELFVRNGITIGTSSLRLTGASTGSIINSTQGGLSLATNGSGRLIVTNDGFVGIGTTTPQALLDVAGDMRVNRMDLGAGQRSDDGECEVPPFPPLPYLDYGNILFGIDALHSNTTGCMNIAIGNHALYSNTTGYGNFAIGPLALHSNISGYGNFAFGGMALGANTTGNANMAFGAASLAQNTGGFGNLGIGIETLFSNSTGSANIAIGIESLRSNTTGGGNVAVGVQGLRSNTIGSGNLAFGIGALDGNIVGNFNMGIGGESLFTNTTGSFNIAIGSGSLYANQGSYNLALGIEALAANADGEHNVGIGHSVLVNNISGIYNTAIGDGTGLGISVGSYNTIIGAQVGGLPDDLSSNIIIADGQGRQRIRVLEDGKVGIGTTTPQALLDVAGDIRVNGLTVGRGGGNRLFNTAFGEQALASNLTALTPTSTAGLGNTAIGYFALNKNTVGISNTAVGAGALASNTEGYINVAVGSASLAYNTEGSGNTAIGNLSLQKNTIGSANTAIGDEAMRNSMTANLNVALGKWSLRTLETGAYNTAIGVSSGEGFISGINNIFIGNHGGGDFFETGDYNTIIGGVSNLGGDALSNRIILANGWGDIGLSMDLTNPFSATATIFANTRVDGTLSINLQPVGTISSVLGLCKTGVTKADNDNQEILNCNGTPSDLAELYETTADVLPGHIVMTTGQTIVYTEQLFDPVTRAPIRKNPSVDTDGPVYTKDQAQKQTSIAVLTRAAKGAPQQQGIVGIASTNPYQVLGTAVADVAKNPRAIAITGRVPTFVNLEHGNIDIGDAIALSSEPGVGMKARPGDITVGIALEPYTGGVRNKVMVAIMPGQYGLLQKIEALEQQVHQVYGLLDMTNPEAISVAYNQAQGTVQYTSGALHLAGESIFGVRSIVGFAGKWRISAEGVLISSIETSQGSRDFYALQSEQSEIVLSGSATLESGRAVISFEHMYSEIIDQTRPMKISVTLTSEANGIFVSDKTSVGFEVQELQGGTSNATFDWVAIVYRASSGSIPAGHMQADDTTTFVDFIEEDINIIDTENDDNSSDSDVDVPQAVDEADEQDELSGIAPPVPIEEEV